MKRFFILSILLLACLVISCNSSDDDDDDENDTPADDDSDDDDNATDDDTSDDDDTVSETWTDEATGLVWQVDPPQEIMTWENAIAYCEDLDLSGFADWRMPTISELRSIVRGCPDTFIGGECGVTDECMDPDCRNNVCIGCDELQGPNEGCYLPAELKGSCEISESYFSILEYNIDAAWSIAFDRANVNGRTFTPGSFVRCVR